MADTTDNKNSINVRVLLYFLIALLIPAGILGMGSSIFNAPQNYESRVIDGNWKINYRGRNYINSRLERFESDGIVAGEKVTLETVLPEDIDIYAPSVTFKSRMARVRVFENGSLVYSYGYDIPEGHFVPKSVHYVPLSSSCGGHFLRIELTAADDDAFSSAYPVTLGNTEDLMRHYLQTRRLALLIGIFMFYFGAVLLVLSPFLIIGAAKDKSVLFSAMISHFLGVYILCYNEVIAYIIHNDVISHVLEYMALYFIPSIMILYILTSGSAGARVRVLRILLVFDLSMATLAVVLHATRILMINHMLPIFHAMILTEGIYLIYVLIRCDREARSSRRNYVGMSSERVLLVGIMLFICSIFLEILRYYLMAYVFKTDESAGIDFITVGALAIVLSIMLNYFFHSIDHLTEARTKVKLYGMAFRDSLTGLDNRASCDQFMAGLDADVMSRYAVVSIDLDGLKIVNDKQGHSIGDMMISGFGELMKDAFSDCELVGRMGGDEFIVIRKDTGREAMESDVRSLILGTEEANRRGGTFRYAFSYGIADSSEGENVQAVYMLADERMYAMKDEHHRQRGIITPSAMAAESGGGANA